MATIKQIVEKIIDYVDRTPPPGAVQFFALAEAPRLWLVCDGSAVSRTTYARLFSAIGTTFGSGDGRTTFNLPNLISRFAEGGTDVGTAKSAGLPDISVGIGHWPEGTFYATDGVNWVKSDSADPSGKVSGDWSSRIWGMPVFKASLSNSIYGNSTTVQPPSLILLPCIHY